MKLNLRAGLVGLAAALALVGCGKKQEQAPPAAEAAKPEAAAPANTEEKVVNVYNWSDYIDPKMLEEFTKQTGIKVNYDVFDNNEVLQTKLLAGNTGYDVVVPSASFLELQIKAGVFQKLDKSLLPNWKYLDKNILERVAKHDPGNQYAVNHMWGTDAIGYNVKKAKAVAPDAPLNSWKVMFDPAWVSKFKSCGVSVLDAPDEVVGIVLAYLGKDPNSENLDDLKLAEDTLMKIRPYIKTINSSPYIDALANGDLCLVLGWSGDILQARSRAEEAKQGVEIGMNVPTDGTIIWFDMYAIPADAPHPKNAHAFINFMMEPKVAAANSNFVHYANGNAASIEFLDPAVHNDPGVYPPPEVMAKLFPNLARSQEFTRELNRAWTRFMTGK
ncbi:MAG TPA: polyamine ABC transporter substrate-binding protein [Steroidobacteraceae bacterium]|nr:polyamine ABC transporter substrate-binding protein [Steroidobacteraceae bacterium]